MPSLLGWFKVFSCLFQDNTFVILITFVKLLFSCILISTWTLKRQVVLTSCLRLFYYKVPVSAINNLYNIAYKSLWCIKIKSNFRIVHRNSSGIHGDTLECLKNSSAPAQRFWMELVYKIFITNLSSSKISFYSFVCSRISSKCTVFKWQTRRKQIIYQFQID